LKKILILLIVLVTSISCENEYEEVPTYGDPSIIKVRINIDSKAKFDRIELRTSYQEKLTDSYIFNKKTKRKYIFLKAPSGGESVIQLFSIYKKDTVFSQQIYVEGGYRENFILLKDTLIHL
jgi:hypothetical protein